MTGKLIIFWSLVIWAAVLWVWLFGGAGLLFWGAMLVVIAMAFSRHRQTRRDAFVQMLALAAEREMPLAPLAAAFAKETHGWQFAALAARLEAGDSLWRALSLSGADSSGALAVAAIAGEKTGSLGPALRDAAKARRAHSSLWQIGGEQVLYLCMLILVALLALAYYSWRIMPQMVLIFEDFATELPPFTQMVVGVTSWIAATGLATVLGFVLAALMLAVVGYYIGWLRFRVPLLGRISDRLDAAGVLRALAPAAERQQSFEPVLVALSARHPNRALRRRLKYVADDVSAGREWVEALLARRLVRGSEAALLRSAERVGNLPWALREAAEGIGRRLAYRLRALSYLAFPLAILAIGAVVMMFVVGYFLPLVTLITNMSM